MYLHHRLNSSRLVVLLQQWTREDVERALQWQTQPPQSDVAEQLGHWLGTVDAVKLSRALHAIESLPSDFETTNLQEVVLDMPALAQCVEQAKAALTVLITAGVAPPKPVRARADNTPVQAPDPEAGADFAAQVPRYLDLQKQMDSRLLALRTHVRHSLSKGTLALRQLAALDGVMEQMLGAREQRLWSLLSIYLERRFAYRQQQHQQALQTRGAAHEPLRWRQPGGWLWAFEQDLQALLLAELQVRLQPITGLLEAVQQEKTG